MNNHLCSRYRHDGLICLLALQGTFLAGSASVACYVTPRIAADATAPSPLSSAVLNHGGYRVTTVQTDPVLGRRWAIVASCDHPEWPAFAVPMNGTGSLKTLQKTRSFPAENVGTATVVRVGDIVQLWKQENFLRIEVAGISEESGALGKTVRVRLLSNNSDGQSVSGQFSGTVRGPLNVEIQP
jgi:Chaperone for flagella basal body P-ring formation